jgi:rhodanese-related sulfurtransferase
MGLGPKPLFRPSSLILSDQKGEESKGDSQVKVDSLVGDSEDEQKSKQLLRSQSESAIKHAVAMAEDDPLLIGDGSRRYILPLVDDGKQTDLKQISGQTLTALIDGKYQDSINEYFIIDCRYPYEYSGGHIKGSHNIHTQKQLFEMFLEHRTKLSSPSNKRVLIIFHCEFSSQRGPGMCRFMRGADRSINGESFPNLHYPELYILKGGYKSFYESHIEYCVPCLYTPMDDPGHSEELKLYRSKSKQDLYKANSSSQMKVHRPAVRKFDLSD